MHERLSARPWRLVGLGLFVALTPGMIGCGASTATVSGVVKYKDTSLKGGTVKFQTSDKKWAQDVPIGTDGTYTFHKVPVGPIQVAVVTSTLKPSAASARGRGRPPGDSPAAKDNPIYDPGAGDRYVAIPLKYEDYGKSGLEFEVTKGKMEHDIILP